MGGSSFADSESDRLGAFRATAFVSGSFFVDVDSQIKSATVEPDTDVLGPVNRRR